MYYGFYAGEHAIQKMLINSFPEQLGGKDPFDPGFFITGLNYVRHVTKRRDIGVHIAYIAHWPRRRRTHVHRRAVRAGGRAVQE